MRFLLSIASLFISVLAIAQTTPASDSTNNASNGDVEIIVDADVEKMENGRIWERKEAAGKRPTYIEGFRVMIGFDKSRTNASRLLSSASAQYNHQYPTMMQYDEPNFKVYLGEFLTYNDAAKVVNTIRKSYQLARVIKDKIKAPEGYWDNEEEE